MPAFGPVSEFEISAPQEWIYLDAASTSAYQAAQSTYSWSHTCTGANRFIVVGVEIFSAAVTVSSVTYNSIALSLIGATGTGAVRSEMWGLLAPDTGAHNVTVTLSGSGNSTGNAVSLAEVDQTVPDEDTNTATALNVGAADATVSVTPSTLFDWIIDAVATSDTAINVLGGQTSYQQSLENVTGAAGTGGMSVKWAQNPAGAGVAMAWTNVGAAQTWATVATCVKPFLTVTPAYQFSSRNPVVRRTYLRM